MTDPAAAAALLLAGRRLGAECEIAVRLARDLVPDGRPVGRSEAAAAVAACAAAAEVVEDRYEDFRALDAATLVAANSLAARGRRLRAGDVVLLGSVVETRWIDPGAAVEVENDPLGRVEVRFL